MANPLNDVVAGFQDLVAQVPDIVQPLIIAVAGAVPFIEGEGSAMIGVIGGVNPIVAALAGIVGNLICVVLVVLLSSRIRTAAVNGRARRTATRNAAAVGASGTESTGTLVTEIDDEPAEKQSKGQQKLRRWLVRFGVPGASLIGPLALPTHFTAATLVASGIGKGRVIFWQAIAIVLWTVVVTAAATGALAAITA